MKIFNLQCKQGHTFEGWFASAEACDDQQGRGLLECPLCASRAQRIPTASYVISGLSSQPKPPADVTSPEAAAGPSMQALVRDKIIAMARSLIEQSDYVGRDFPEEARRIHYQEAPERSIVGEATVQEAKELIEEGIDLVPLPSVSGAKGRLQ